jgi:hypothetical protein
MSDPLNDVRRRTNHIAIPTIQVAFALSLVLHALLLSGWLPKLPLPEHEELAGKPNAPLAVRLTPLPGGMLAPPPAPPSPQARPAPMPRMPSTQTPLRPNRSLAPKPSAPVLTAERAEAPALAPSAPPAGDFAALVEARRRSREAAAAPQESAPAQPVESQRERDSRIAAANLGLDRTPTFGSENRNGGGIFQVARLGYDDAEFFFFGWNKAIRRNATQMIEVRRGDNPTTELAVVRRMIAIIREHESGDFTWDSRRLGRDVRLSARLSDNAGLEDFMMREFFPAARPRN